MPQFEVEPRSAASQFVRAREAVGAVRQAAALADSEHVEIAEAEAGTGWCAVTVQGQSWGRVRPRDRMRFRRD